MRGDVALTVGEALYPMLSVFQALGQQRLRTVRQIESDSCLDRIIFDFETLSLIVSAVPDDDSIDFEFAETRNAAEPGAVDVSKSHLWKDFADVPFGWG